MNSQGISRADKIAVPRPYSKLGCMFCDTLTREKSYKGRLREYRTENGQTIPWIDTSTGIRLNRTMDFYTDTGQTFTGGEICHNATVHRAVEKVKNLIAFTVVRTQMKRYILTQDNRAKEPT